MSSPNLTCCSALPRQKQWAVGLSGAWKFGVFIFKVGQNKTIKFVNYWKTFIVNNTISDHFAQNCHSLGQPYSTWECIIIG